MQFPDSVKQIIYRLEAAGYESYAVGGCVRDSLIGLTPPDYDIATSALPNETKRVFVDYKTVNIGEKHGTIAVIIENEKIEVTSFRCDGDYSDNRRPDNVIFTRDLKSDLSRRDFTVNAMAFTHSMKLIDLFGGEEDLKNGILKCVGDPEKRFSEDALRIMRALRLMSEHGFKPEAETERALRKLKNRLLKIAPERIATELNRLLLGNYAENIILDYHDVLSEFIPELKPLVRFNQHNKYHIYDVLTHTAKVVAGAPKEKIIRLAALFHDIAKPECFMFKNGYGHFYGHAEKGSEIAGKILERLRYDNFTKHHVKLLIKNHDDDIYTDNINVKKALNKFGIKTLEQICSLRKADDSAKAEFVKERKKEHNALIEKAREIIKNRECYSLKSLAVNGNDLSTLGFKGEEIGKKLNELLEFVIEGKIENNKAQLLKHIKDKGI